MMIPIQVDKASAYEIAAAFTKAPDYGVIRVAIDGKTLVDGLDLYEPGRVVSTNALLLGTMELAAGSHEIEIEIVGTNPNAVKQFMVGVDYLFLKQLP